MLVGCMSMCFLQYNVSIIVSQQGNMRILLSFFTSKGGWVSRSMCVTSRPGRCLWWLMMTTVTGCCRTIISLSTAMSPPPMVSNSSSVTSRWRRHLLLMNRNWHESLTTTSGPKICLMLKRSLWRVDHLGRRRWRKRLPWTSSCLVDGNSVDAIRWLPSLRRRNHNYLMRRCGS